MKKSTIKTWALFVMVLAVAVLIVLNPVFKYSQIITSGLNNFFEMCKIGYNFSQDDTITVVRFLEYFILGTGMTALITRLSSKTLFKNSPLIMFVGLFIAVLEAHFRRLYIEDALISFIWIFIAMIFYMALIRFGKAPSKKSNSKYKINKYDRRR